MPLLALPLLLAAIPQSEAWRIIPGTMAEPPPIEAATIRTSYFRGLKSEIAPLAELDLYPESSRLVFGLPAADPAIEALAARLGVSRTPRGLQWEGRTVRPGSGLRLGIPDPDGRGTLVLIVAPDEAGLRAPFTVRMDLLARGFTIASEGKLVEEGAAPLFLAEDFAPGRALAIRLDLTIGAVMDETARWPIGERARRLGAALSPYAEVLTAAAGAAIEPEAFAAELLRAPAGTLQAARDLFAARELQGLADKLWGRCLEVFGPPAVPAPRAFFLLAPPAWTNAATFAPDGRGSPRVLVNLAAFADHVALETAVAHEFAHVLQAPGDGGLPDRCAREGVATFLSQQLIPGTPDAVALMWTEEELRGVEERADEILSRFADDAYGGNRPRVAQWTRADLRHRDFPAAPSRLGYWVGWRAARAWRAAHPDEPLATLLSIPPDTLLKPILP